MKHKKEHTHTPNLHTLNIQLIALNKKIEQQLSFKRSIMMSVLNGAGYALGATIVAGIIITILTWTIQSVQDVPILNKIMLSQTTTQSR